MEVVCRERPQCCSRKGSAVQVSLGHMASECLQLDGLSGSLDSFGDRRKAQRFAETDDRTVLGAVVELVDEGPVDLERLDGKALQVAQRSTGRLPSERAGG